ncbi:hypothetical protein ANCCEY_13439 [Ancylostoma ceylanicum]|uniref:Uncharacterized protein n=1 Tax=Ancylostoma ceylanicum TaxID=53326 RepID=A0A0D6L8U3_9BILA|nr:hypothetical protein ANCCEY_13439 [Ancylostoma ceylanicum]
MLITRAHTADSTKRDEQYENYLPPDKAAKLQTRMQAESALKESLKLTETFWKEREEEETAREENEKEHSRNPQKPKETPSTSQNSKKTPQSTTASALKEAENTPTTPKSTSITTSTAFREHIA